jgi:hypothetical protein
MKKNVDDIFEREDERREAMQQLLVDYLDTIDDSEVSQEYNVTKWAASELIMFLAYYVADTHYEMVGILDECKDELRKRNKRILEMDDDVDNQ